MTESLSSSARPSWRRVLNKIACSACILIILCALSVAIIQFPPPFAFIKSAHPSDIVNAHGGHWQYFHVFESPVAVLTTARKELAGKGYSENLMDPPWHKFSKGDSIVIVSPAGEIATLINSGPVHRASQAVDHFDDTEIWVHSSGNSQLKYMAFQVKKRLLGW